MYLFTQKQGFTLIEVMMYIALLASILMVLFSLAFTIIGHKTKQGALLAVQLQGSHIMDIMGDQIRRATAINMDDSKLNQESSVLVLQGSSVTTTFSLRIDSVFIEGVKLGWNPLEFQEEGKDAIDLVSERVTVDRFYVTDLSTTNTQAVQIDLELSTVQLGDDPLFYANYAWQESFTLRVPK